MRGLSLPKLLFVEQQLIQRSGSLIDAAESIVITAHRSPDGDAVGSSLALWHYLKAKSKNAKVILPDGFAEFLAWMPGVDEILLHSDSPNEVEEAIKEADLIFCLDYNDLSRTGDLAPLLEKRVGKCPFILIDHHQHPDTFPEVLISDTSSCSTAQLIYEFIDALGDADMINAQMGECVYTGIVTDSGSFRFPSVTPETHRIAASLIEKGVDHAAIHRRIYDTNLLDRLRLVGYALSEKLIVFPEYHTAYISLSQEELTRFNYRPGDTEGLVNQALSIKGINMACFIREGNNKVKMSFRSKGPFKVNEVAAKHFNGGGHHNAAGGVSDLSLQSVIDKFVAMLPEYQNDLNYDVS